MTIISITVDKNPLEEMEQPSLTTKESKMQYLGVIWKKTEWTLSPSKADHSISQNPSLCPTTNAEEVEVEWFYDDLQDLLELTSKKKMSFSS